MDLSTPKVMGILNITPDSFYDGGRYNSEKDLNDRVETLISEGADIIDIGGYSSRPGAMHIDEQTERNRVLTGLSIIRKHNINIPISVDTFRASIAEIALDNGASIINDISAGAMDKSMYSVVAKHQAPYIMMHMVGSPQTMSQHTSYDNIITRTIDYFAKKLPDVTQLGIKDVIIDVGFGFSKTIGQNYLLMDNLAYFRTLNLPILVGISRKSMIYKTLRSNADASLNGTTALNTMAMLNGADILRVHDVKEAKEAVILFNQLKR